MCLVCFLHSILCVKYRLHGLHRLQCACYVHFVPCLLFAVSAVCSIHCTECIDCSMRVVCSVYRVCCLQPMLCVNYRLARLQRLQCGCYVQCVSRLFFCSLCCVLRIDYIDCIDCSVRRVCCLQPMRDVNYRVHRLHRLQYGCYNQCVSRLFCVKNILNRLHRLQKSCSVFSVFSGLLLSFVCF